MKKCICPSLLSHSLWAAIIISVNNIKNNQTFAFGPALTSSSILKKHDHNNFIAAITATATVLHQSATSTEQDFRQASTIPTTSSLSTNTFAGQVEKAIIAKFGEAETTRVLQSWRLLEKDYVHSEYVGGNDNEELKKTSNCYQYTHSHVHGLSCIPFWDVNQQPWANKLEKKYKTIRKELLDVSADLNKLKQEGNNIWAGALTEEAGGYGEGWSTLVLMNRGMWDETNCNLFPKTAKAVRDCGVPATEIFFASMKPHSDIKLHSDFTNFVLTSHLAVDIPENGNNKCRLTIGDETRQWINGEVMLFDTSIMHDAINESDDMRYILMFRVWHPDLTQVERDALQLIYDCLEVPDLLDDNEYVRQAAEQEIVKVRTFPKLKTTTTGFGGKGADAGKKNNKKKKNRK
mmetsp:Transcript_10075/g.11710  ORF Transcript_10075/g.11710 Transcript_10075/m.11710 type:complete len:405 (+) Transcript_10075:118-1332(+)